MAKRATTKIGSRRSTSKSTGKRRAKTATKAKAKKSAIRASKTRTVRKKTAARGKTVAKRRATAKRRPATGKPKTGTKRTAILTSARGAVKKTTLAKSTSQDTTPPPADFGDLTAFPEETRPLPKTPLTDKDLGEFKRLLLRKRNELVGDVRRLTSEAFNRRGEGAGEHSSMPIHMADLGSDNWEQEFTLGLIANEEAVVREIDEALERIENKTYGICLATRKRISKARLRAKPWAKYCIDYARARDEGRAP